METENPFIYPLSTYLFVIGLSSISGAIKCINNVVYKKQSFSFLQFISDMLTGGLAGLMAFWICDSMNITDSKMYVAVTVAGIMGIRAWNEFETLVKQILRIPDQHDK